MPQNTSKLSSAIFDIEQQVHELLQALESAPIQHLGESDAHFIEVYKAWYRDVRGKVLQSAK